MLQRASELMVKKKKKAACIRRVLEAIGEAQRLLLLAQK